MRNFISINQVGFFENGDPGIDIIDAALLSYIAKWFAVGKSKIRTVDGVNYVWIDHGTTAEQLPLLRLKKDAVKKRLLDLQKNGWITKQIFDIWTPYYALTEKAEKALLGEPVRDQNPGGCDDDAQGGVTETHRGGRDHGHSNALSIPNGSKENAKKERGALAFARGADAPAPESEPPQPEDQALTEAFFEQFEQATGQKSTQPWGKVRKLIRTCLQRAPADRIQASFSAFFADPNCAAAGYPVTWFMASLDRYLLAAAGKSAISKAHLAELQHEAAMKAVVKAHAAKGFVKGALT